MARSSVSNTDSVAVDGCDREAVAVGRRAADRDSVMPSTVMSLARDVGRRRHRGGQAVLQHRVGGDAGGDAELQRVGRAGQRGRVADLAVVDPGAAVTPAPALVSNTPLPVRAVMPDAVAVHRQRQVGAGLGATLAGRRRWYCTPPAASTKGARARALAAEQVAAGAVAAVGHRQQLLRGSPSSFSARPLALLVAVARRCRRRPSPRAPAAAVRTASPIAALGQRHRRAAGVDRALAGLGAHLAGQRALGARGGGRVVAGLVDALAGGEALLRVGQLRPGASAACRCRPRRRGRC